MDSTAPMPGCRRRVPNAYMPMLQDSSLKPHDPGNGDEEPWPASRKGSQSVNWFVLLGMLGNNGPKDDEYDYQAIKIMLSSRLCRSSEKISGHPYV